MNSEITILPISSEKEIHSCTMILVNSDPWKKLELGYDDLIKMFRDPLNETFVAKLNDSIMGFIILNMHGTFRGYVKCLAVSAASRGTGVGKKLIEFAEEKIFKVVPNVFICVTSFNTKAQEFYKKLGYKQIGVIENFIAQGSDEFLLRKTLGPLKDYKPKPQK